ncbi:biotin-dependent carboxyltransferase family protein [Photobacterium sagamiensis]|uniref:5-oxoprolinase subunit C family protein n=1 Tax=Photobacterium sagamiensis TaxID=2910241 RepID=UPI003D0BE17D
MLTLLQDIGRLGVAQQGLSQGGAVDLHAYCWANYLLGNEMVCSQLEITLGQASFRADSDLFCAIAGADLGATLDDQPIAPWQSFHVQKGQTLAFGYPKAGLRAYLAVGGGFQIPPVLGSVSAVVRNKMGGLRSGQPLEVGDKLSVASMETLQQAQQQRCARHSGQSIPPRYIPDYNTPLQLRVIESYQHALFSAEEKDRIYQNAYKLTQHSDRMGCRLEGPAVATQLDGIVSEGIAYGAIQIPANGQPIILLNDRQTLGGYPKLGCVARVDMPKLAQAMPGKEIQFLRGDLDTLVQEWQQFSRFFGLPF